MICGFTSGYGPPPGYPSAPPPPPSPYDAYPPQAPPGYPYAAPQTQGYQGYFNGGGYPPPPPQQLPPYQVYQYDEHHHHCHDHHDDGSSFLRGWYGLLSLFLYVLIRLYAQLLFFLLIYNLFVGFINCSGNVSS